MQLARLARAGQLDDLGSPEALRQQLEIPSQGEHDQYARELRNEHLEMLRFRNQPWQEPQLFEENSILEKTLSQFHRVAGTVALGALSLGITHHRDAAK